MRKAIAVLLIVLSNANLAGAGARSPLSTERWSYIVAYEGLFSAGIPVNIAAVHLSFGPAQANGERGLIQAALNVSTEGYETPELLFPVRFCYTNRLEAEQWATLEADWLSREGTRVTRGRLEFDREKRRVLRLRARRELDAGRGVKDIVPRSTGSADQAEPQIRTKLEQQSFPEGVLPMDALSMVLWLREQPLQPGIVLQPKVRDGDDLLGFRIEVEALETLLWHGDERAALRVRLEPRVNDDDDVLPTWMWLSQDAERLVLRIRSDRAFGELDARLLPASEASGFRCEVPEAAALELPSL